MNTSQLMIMARRLVRTPSFLTPDEKKVFPGFHYWDYDPEYATTEFIHDVKKEPTGRENGEGILAFKLKDRFYEFKTLVFDDGQGSMINIAFRAPGDGSYPGGRYFNITEDQKVLDFNASSLLLCAHSPRYTCTIPENVFDIPIPAGEKYVNHE